MATCIESVYYIRLDVLKESSDKFSAKREKPREENVRKLILEALKLKKESFAVLIPEKRGWNIGQEAIKESSGRRLGDVYEWALLCAQRIVDGESWEDALQNPTESNLLLLDEEGRCMTISRRFINLEQIGMNVSSERRDRYGYWEPRFTVVMITAPLDDVQETK